MVELLLKEATVHDVEKCWKMIDDDQRQGPMGRALQMKVLIRFSLSLRAELTHLSEWLCAPERRTGDADV